MLNTSFVLYTLAPKKSLKENLREVSENYLRKYGQLPNTFFVNSAIVRRDYAIGRVRIIRKKTIMRHTVGVAYQGAAS
jgi:hypothetical protein